MKKWFVSALLVINSLSYGATQDCYTIRYLFFDVAMMCISYRYNGNIKTEASAFSTGILKILKDIKYSGFAIADNNLSSKKFHLYRKENSLIEIHDYIFYPGYILFKKVKIKGADEEKKEEKLKNEKYIDPFTATLYYYNQIIKKEKIKRKIFFNGRSYLIPVKDIKETSIKINEKEYPAVYGEINPTKVEVGGLIQPTGIWKIWIDKKGKRLLKGILKIKAGTVIVEIKE